MLKWYVRLWSLVLIGVFCFCPLPVLAAEFSADMLEKKAGKRSQESRLYVKDAKYRLTVQSDERTLFIIVDAESGTTTVLSPQDKQYMEVPNDYFRSMSENPVQSFRYHAQRYDRRELGRERFKGFECTKVGVQAGERELYTAWVSKELNFPLKIVFHLGKGMSMELANITQGAVESSLFKIPDGYTLKKE